MAKITFKGNPMTLVGPELKVGDAAPDFSVVDNALTPVNLATYAGKVKIISAVPSLDTPVCDTETRRFNQEAAKLPGGVAVLTVSLDLPFAQKRWCGAAGIDKVVTLSDYRDRSFGLAYGFYEKSNLPALWVHRLFGYTELEKRKVCRVLLYKKSELLTASEPA